MMTSLQTDFECMLEGRSGRGHDIAGLLNEGPGTSFDRYPGMYNDVWNTTALRNLPSALAWPATSPEPNAGPVALAREAHSAITEALQHIFSTYGNMGAHPIPAYRQRGPCPAILSNLAPPFKGGHKNGFLAQTAGE